MSRSFRIKLEGSQQNPAVLTGATGLGTAVFDTKSGALSYVMVVKGVDFGPFVGLPEGTSDPGDDVNGAHFHSGARGVNGPVILDWLPDDDDFKVTALKDGSWRIEGRWEKGEDGDSIAPFVNALKNAVRGADIGLYANIHTADNGGGEIRGQLVGLSTDAGETVNGGAGADILPGLGGADRINGRGGKDAIDGGTGNDRLSGGADKDVFLFTTRLNKNGNVDRILDFAPGEKIHLDNAVFAGLKVGALKGVAFYEGPFAYDESDRIIRDGDKLIFDKNGDKAGGATLFARIDADIDLSAKDFVVI